MKVLMSFSQEYEDIILYNMLENVIGNEIFWIDVGAYDPIRLSVTKFFETYGGKGINIEPQKKFIDLLKEDRPLDINLEIGISNEEGALYLYGDNSLASFDSENKWVRDKNKIIVEVKTLKWVCENYLKKNSVIHFMKIDVEGFERKCLEGMDFNNWRPWIVVVESTEPMTNIPCYDKWEDILIQAGYVFVGMSGINRYYVANEQKHLKELYLNANELKKKYRIVKYDEIG